MRILIAGVGAIGSNLTARLVSDLKGAHSITVLDKDTVESRNVTPGTQLYLPDQVGLSKVEALQFNIYKMYEREIEIENTNLIFPCQNLFHRFDLVIDCFDNYNSRSAIQLSWKIENLKTNNCGLLHIGFSDQFTYAVEWAENYTPPSDITTGFDICEMEGAAAFVNFVTSLGASVAEEYVNKGKKLEFVGGKFLLQEIL